MRKKLPFQRVIFDLHGVLINRATSIQEDRAPARIIASLRRVGLEVGFVTNSSSLSATDVAELLHKQTIEAYPHEIITAGLTMANYIKRHFNGANIYLIGNEGLRRLIDDVCMDKIQWVSGDKANVVVVGRDLELTEEKIKNAAIASRQNAILLATSRDICFPVNGAWHVGPGYTVDQVESAMGTKAYVVGKPNPFGLVDILGLSQADLRKTLIVGDSFDTDVLFGMNAGAATALLCNSVQPLTIKKYADHNWILQGLEHILQLVGL